MFCSISKSKIFFELNIQSCKECRLVEHPLIPMNCVETVALFIL